jgi:hypothetical protein
MQKIKLISIILLFSLSASAAVIYPVQEGFFAKIWRCTWHISCYRTLGASVTTIQGTDTLSSSRAVINTNFANLNSDKIENATTSVAAITTLSNLVSVGTLTTGVWSASTIAINKGGTASTSPSGILWGDGAGAYTSIGQGVSGQLLTSNGATIPTFVSPSVDTTIPYVWTGQHTIGTTSPTYSFQNATTTFTNEFAKVGIGTTTPSVVGLSVATDTYIGRNAYIGGGLGVGKATTTAGAIETSGMLGVGGTTTTNGLALVNGNICVGCVGATIVSVTSSACSTSAGASCSATAICATGDRVVGGGVVASIEGQLYMIASYPSGNDRWTGTFNNQGTVAAHTINTYAICANP